MGQIVISLAFTEDQNHFIFFTETWSSSPLNTLFPLNECCSHWPYVHNKFERKTNAEKLMLLMQLSNMLMLLLKCKSLLLEQIPQTFAPDTHVCCR